MGLIRKAKRQDSKSIWKIRNHPVVRGVSGNSRAFSFKQHDLWFKNKYFKDVSNFCYVLESNNKVVGYCRLDFNADDNNYVISIAIDPNYHNKGFGTLLLSKSLQEFDKIDDIIAEIKKDNISSIKLFQKNNFEIINEDEIKYYLRYTRK